MGGAVTDRRFDDPFGGQGSICQVAGALRIWSGVLHGGVHSAVT